MKIAICGSIDFVAKIKEVADTLSKEGHSLDIPLSAQRILTGELTLEEFKNEKNKEDRKIKEDVINYYFEKIKNSDVILIINEEKKGVPGYIGGNTFLEMGFAHVLKKKIFLLNPIPEMGYTDEIRAMQPICLNGDLFKLE